jgi:hypothetical protein
MALFSCWRGDSQHNDTYHNNPLHNDLIAAHSKAFFTIMLIAIMLCRYAECGLF